MNAAADFRGVRQALLRDSKHKASIAHEAALSEFVNANDRIIQRLTDMGALPFVVVPVQTAESHDSREPVRASHSKELILLPVQWRSISPRFDLKTSAFPLGRLNDFVQFGNVRINFSAHEVVKNESSVCLTSMEVKTLEFFVANLYRAISRDELLNEVWGYDSYPCTRTVDNRILRLRQKLEADAANPRHFITVYGSGYKFVP